MASATEVKKYEPLTEPIRTVAAWTARMANIQDVAIVLAPAVSASHIPAGWCISERAVMAKIRGTGTEGDPYGGDVYKPYGWGDGKLAPTGTLIRKIMIAGGGSLLGTDSDITIPRVVKVNLTIQIPNFGAQPLTFPGERMMDLRDGSDQLPSKPGQIAQMRKRIYELASTEALLRAVRAAWALEQAYTLKDLQTKPFVVYVPMADLDMTDEFTKRLVVATQLGVVERLFGGSSPVPMLAGGTEPEPIVQTANGAVDVRTGEVIDAEAGGDGIDDIPVVVSVTPIYVCGCPCGDQKQITKDVHDKTVEIGGSPRCGECWPGSKFVLHRHTTLPTLGLPKMPAMTPATAEGRRMDLAAKGGAR